MLNSGAGFFAIHKKSFKFAFPICAHTHTHSCYHARIAQLVEHDLAKVGVAGSSPVSRSKKDPPGDFFLPVQHALTPTRKGCTFTPSCLPARMVELVDTLDLKSSGQ